MSDASEKLDRSRRAILEHVARRQRKHDPREEPPPQAHPGEEHEYRFAAGEDEEPPPGSGWFGHLQHGVRTWWRYHPAHMVVDLTTPVLRTYAQRKPAQMLGAAFAAGAVLTLLRPWKLISVTTILVALLKSSQLSNVLMAAMSAADYQKDHNRPD